MGWLLGERFLMLTHTGRTTGVARQTVIEVVDHDEATDTYFVASGWGESSDWLRNIAKTPRVNVRVGTRSFDADAVRLSIAGAVRPLESYAKRHPRSFAQLGKWVLGERLTPTRDDCAKLAARVPVVALQAAPKSEARG